MPAPKSTRTISMTSGNGITLIPATLLRSLVNHYGAKFSAFTKFFDGLNVPAPAPIETPASSINSSTRLRFSVVRHRDVAPYLLRTGRNARYREIRWRNQRLLFGDGQGLKT